MNQTLAYEYIALMVAVLAPVAAAIWVMADAGEIRRLEIHACGLSDCHPSRWGAAVILLPIVAIPIYLNFRRARTALLDSVATASSVSGE